MRSKLIFNMWPNISFKRQFILLIVFSLIAALFVFLILGNTKFEHYINNLIISLIFMSSIYSSFYLIYLLRYRYTKKNEKSFLFNLFSLVLGTIMGLAIIAYLTAHLSGVNFSELVYVNFKGYIQNFILAMIIGTVITSFFTSREKLLKAKSELQQHKLSILDNEKRMLESELKLLQSQIEPHFLFNTLSNIIGLIDKNPTRSKTMMESLTRYLRATLDYTRRDSVTLEDELNMVSAYLAIFKERMGNRLQYKIYVDKNLYKHSFPPMLLQPLVENAIKHGLEPSIDGGYVNILGARHKDKIRLIVEDSGCGLLQEVGKGIGLANVQQRLKVLFGDEATLVLEDIKPNGLRVMIEVPHE